jgi:hypothetical protein
LFNFVLGFIILIVASTVGLRVTTQISDDVNVYWKAMNLTPKVVETALNQTMGIIGNAHAVSANMVPVSTATAGAMLGNSTNKENVSFAMAATSVMAGMSRADWQSVMGNFSLALGSISNINYTAVTGVFRQAQDPDIQSSLKNMTQHALGSFDYATSGMTSLFSLLKDGVISEDKKAKKVDMGKEKENSPPSDLTNAEVDMGKVGTDISAAIAAYKNENHSS